MDNATPIEINGYSTYFMESKDRVLNFLLFVAGHLINQIDYCTTDKMRFIKAYF